MDDRLTEKLTILADAAKYDVSCSSSGSSRKNNNNGLGNTGTGICHTYTEDGRCVSLLKILLTNHCIYDCAYCVSRKSNDIKRAAFTVKEVVDLTISFYRRNYVEGLFLSSGIFKDADYTMERLVLVAKTLREQYHFNGYIHLKAIPGASPELIHAAGTYADRLSVNLEIPTEVGLKLLAPDKNRKDMIGPITYLRNQLLRTEEEKQLFKHTPHFAPAGQSTQMIIGAANESDKQIISVAQYFYSHFKMKRVYYSGYVPISFDSRLPAIGSHIPTIRENRLYQTDWLMRFYGYRADEIVNDDHPLLDLDVDPKLGWALRNMHIFPIDVNTAPRNLLLRIPGVGVSSVQKILATRKFGCLSLDTLKKIGVVTSRAKYFITCRGYQQIFSDKHPDQLKQLILQQVPHTLCSKQHTQLVLF
ncbi:putative DNA modification/repair radical SAM protein [Sphingobacterium suaedae]|uniref:DNA modification/repair radical SAM protein n=1 Tax=Sphingobacterium suaedae TaxID=1686402 RepID=A0ABW5KF40_9SPHI